MANKNTHFELGQMVFVKTDMIRGNQYANRGRTGSTYLTAHHEQHSGKVGVIVQHKKSGYVLMVDGKTDEKVIFFDEMLEEYIDTLAKSDLSHEAKRTVNQIELHNATRSLDNALEKRMFETDKEVFNEVVDAYNKLSRR
ncbi:hypothetical protein pW2_236 [Bacillus phage pW2]|uniref:Uncharacterized protein n=1 Tax=Bacillus phage pW2 TaxID=2500559 RepID=A0A3Q9R7N5_9CAUD|nr:hypothetical protein PQE69_gp111 [Bacillus phage pW2]AZU99007.1 hypothetical protein pW2_236 [Bacillus phage pW2]